MKECCLSDHVTKRIMTESYAIGQMYNHMVMCIKFRKKYKTVLLYCNDYVVLQFVTYFLKQSNEAAYE